MIHNYFTIKALGGEKSYFNAIHNIKQHLKRNKGYAKFIVLGSGGGLENGQLKNVVYSAPVSVRFTSETFEGGVMRAEYYIDITDVQGLEFSELALCENADGNYVSSYAQCESFRYNGEPISVSVTLFVVLEGGMQLVGGKNNAIALWLLGRLPLGGSFKIASGSCDYGGVMNHREISESICEEVSPTLSWGENALYFEAQLNSENGEEFLLMHAPSNNPDQKTVVARFVPLYPSLYKSRNSTIGAQDVVDLEDTHVTHVANVMIDNVLLGMAKVKKKFTSVMEINGLVPFKLGAVSYIKTDPTESYLVAVTHSEVHLLKYANTGMEYLFRMPHAGEYVEVCDNGTLALWGEKLNLYWTDDEGKIMSKAVDVSCGSQNAVTFEWDNRYHVGRVLDGRVQRFLVTTEGEVNSLYDEAAGQNQQLFRNNWLIAWGGKNCPYGVSTSGANHTGYAQKLNECFNMPGAQIEAVDKTGFVNYDGGCGLVLLRSALLFPLDTSKTYIFCESCYLEKSNLGYKLFMIDPATQRVLQVGGIMQFEKQVQQVRVTGSFCFLLHEDGTITSLHLSGNKSYMYLDTLPFKEGKKAYYDVRCNSVPMPASQKLKARFTITYT